MSSGKSDKARPMPGGRYAGDFLAFDLKNADDETARAIEEFVQRLNTFVCGYGRKNGLEFDAVLVAVLEFTARLAAAPYLLKNISGEKKAALAGLAASMIQKRILTVFDLTPPGDQAWPETH